MTQPSGVVRARQFLGLTAVVFGLGLCFPVIGMDTLGKSEKSYSVLTGIWDLAQTGNALLALIILAFSVCFPVVKLLALRDVTRLESEEDRRRALSWLTVLGKWSMLDVFVVAILIGAAHLGILSSARPRFGIYLFGAGILMAMAATVFVTRILAAKPEMRTPERGQLTRPLDRVVTLMALGTFLVGVNLPLMEVTKWLFWNNEYTLLTAVLEMFGDRHFVLGTVLAVFVLAVPLVRCLFLGYVRTRGVSDRRSLRSLLILDEWAMLDVYVLALLIVLIKLTDLAGVTPQAGLWWLVGSAVLSGVDSWRLRRVLLGTAALAGAASREVEGGAAPPPGGGPPG